MNIGHKPELKEIRKIYTENFLVLNSKFLNFQSNFLSDLYKISNKDLEKANIILYFQKKTFQLILELRLTNLNHDISFDKLDENFNLIKQKKNNISQISTDLNIPKETARRKISELINENILELKENKVIYNLNNKYQEIILKHIKKIINFLEYFTQLSNFYKNKENINNQILKKFSFISYHFLITELEYLKIWKISLKDLELLLIKTQCEIKIQNQIIASQVNVINSKKFIIDANHSAVGATSISQITGIPRASCIRKLELLCDIKILKKDVSSKRFYSNMKNNKFSYLNIENYNKKIIDSFSKFLYNYLSNLNS